MTFQKHWDIQVLRVTEAYLASSDDQVIDDTLR